VYVHLIELRLKNRTKSMFVILLLLTLESA